MIKIKKDGFTLSEVLIALAVAGVLAMLVLPGLIKDTNNRAMMSAFQSTLSNVTSAIQNELVKTAAKDLSDTNIYKDPVEFLKSLDPTRVEGKKDIIYYPTGGYKAINGSYQTGIATSAYNASAILKNGVGIAILTDGRTAGGPKHAGEQVALISIDLNGAKEPNIIGVDMFEIEIAKVSDLDNGVHIGDPIEYSTDKQEVITKCKEGTPLACTDLVILSGYNPNYLEEN